MASLHDFEANSISGGRVSLDGYRGHPVLVVNTASACGFTPQYAGLESLHRRYAERGLAVLGFPCNQFGGQEPGTEAEIQSFCERNFGVTFPLFAKVEVNGPEAHPLFAYATGPQSPHPGAVKWNFEKFLFDREGHLQRRFSSRIDPEGRQIQEAIEGLL